MVENEWKSLLPPIEFEFIIPDGFIINTHESHGRLLLATISLTQLCKVSLLYVLLDNVAEYWIIVHGKIQKSCAS
jgi:hypothetical protein